MISIIVITKNEEERIEACLESIKWADEIIVIDNGSTDKTKEIVKKYTDKIFDFVGQNFASLRNQALDKVSSDWVLYVDADERVLAPLKEEINFLVKQSENTAYAISRKNIIFGSEQKYGPFWPDWVIRLFKRDNLESWTGDVHEQPVFNGKLGYTKNSLLHLTHRNLDQIMLKSLSWSKIDANLRLASNHPNMSSWRFLRILFSELFYQGIVRKGFFSGTIAIMDCLLQTFSMVMTYIRLWEMQQPESLDEKYKLLDQKLIESGFKFD